MADEVDVLLGKIENVALRDELRAAVDRVRAKRSFGLVFESHLPERVRLHDHPIRRGVNVVRRDEADEAFQGTVEGVSRGEATVTVPDGSTHRVPVADLVVTAEFGEPIYPGLTRLGSIDRGGDKPAHIVINAENHHALEMLQFTHAGKVDCIYIDPPYNTGAKDWKYDNDYVDGEDAYRHSKWLAFMERRLLLAKQLLNPLNSVLIVTIDEKEVHRLQLLLQQVFSASTIQMVTIVTNPSGTSRDTLSRVEEYAFFVFIGSAEPARVGDNLLTESASLSRTGLPWESLLRRGNAWYRSERPNLCYPIFVDSDTKQITGVGEPFSGEDEGARVTEYDGGVAAWPVRRDGRLGIWRKERSAILELASQGYLHVSGFDRDRNTWAIRYLMSGTTESISNGRIRVERTGKYGEVEARDVVETTAVAKTVWNRGSHNAGTHGSALLRLMIPGRAFPFPKSLYAVEDAVRIAVLNKPDAVVLDFFVGSGTTTHAVMRLNRQDDGRRQSIVVTNNEVSADEARSLRARGLRPGDREWEELGIFEHITCPRITAAVTGLTPDGEPVKGDYKFTDEFPMAEGFEENVQFMKLTYQDPVDVELDNAFTAIAPLLWMRAGGQGDMIQRLADVDDVPVSFDYTDRYAVLFDADRWREFIEVLPATVTTVFVVTDSASMFAGVAEALPSGVEPVRLYENYLSTFAINRGESA